MSLPQVFVEGEGMMVFEPDNVMPAQLRRGPWTRDPERALRVRVMEDALDAACMKLRDNTQKDKNLWVRDQAREWILSDDLLWPYSFLPLCEVLDLDPAAIRESLLKGNWTLKGGPIRASVVLAAGHKMGRPIYPSRLGSHVG